VINTLLPFKVKRSPSRTAVVLSAATSDPASGSVMAIPASHSRLPKSRLIIEHSSIISHKS